MSAECLWDIYTSLFRSKIIKLTELKFCTVYGIQYCVSNVLCPLKCKEAWMRVI